MGCNYYIHSIILWYEKDYKWHRVEFVLKNLTQRKQRQTDMMFKLHCEKLKRKMKK